MQSFLTPFHHIHRRKHRFPMVWFSNKFSMETIVFYFDVVWLLIVGCCDSTNSTWRQLWRQFSTLAVVRAPRSPFLLSLGTHFHFPLYCCRVIIAFVSFVDNDRRYRHSLEVAANVTRFESMSYQCKTFESAVRNWGIGDVGLQIGSPNHFVVVASIVITSKSWVKD